MGLVQRFGGVGIAAVALAACTHARDGAPADHLAMFQVSATPMAAR
jgi:hypothetical protein